MSDFAGIAALLAADAPNRWQFAGDSITHGAAHTVGWRDYTELFSERVRWELGRPRDIVIKAGISGWTIADLIADLEWNVLQFHPDCVSLVFGMNDCVRGPAALEHFERTYIAVIDRIRDESGAMHQWLAHGCHPNEYGHRMLAHTLFRELGIWEDKSWTCQLNIPGYDPHLTIDRSLESK